jgi:hypothetical protein
MDLDPLAGFPSVESVVASAGVRTGRELPQIRELLLDWYTPAPDPATMSRLTGLEVLYGLQTDGRSRLDLENLPAGQMRKLAASHWSTNSLAPIERMTGLRKLRLDAFREPLDAVSRMTLLEFLHVKGPAKGWANLRDCPLLEEAHLIEVQIANLRRWNTWRRLRILILAGRGVRSLAGLENCESLEQLTLINLRMADLAPLRDLANLRTLTLRMADEIDLASIGMIPGIQSFTVDSSVSDGRPVRVPTLRPLAEASAIEEISLREIEIEDGDLLPLANLPKLRRVRLDCIGGLDVPALRIARPDVEIQHTAPDPRLAALQEVVGAVTLQRPGGGLQQWSIFQSMAPSLGLPTNYDAERRIRREVGKRTPELAKRLEWDSEGGAVGIYAAKENDIRAVAEIINELLASVGAKQRK